MVKETTFIGVAMLLFAVVVLIRSFNVFVSATFIMLGVLMIVMGRDENKIEARNDGKK